VAVEPQDAIEQLGAKAVHHAHHDDERCDTEHDGNKADRRDEENEPFALARQQIAPRYHRLIGGQDHVPPPLRPSATSGNCSVSVAQ